MISINFAIFAVLIICVLHIPCSLTTPPSHHPVPPPPVIIIKPPPPPPSKQPPGPPPVGPPSPFPPGPPGPPPSSTCPVPNEEILRCMREWACQYLIRLDLRCLLNLNGNPLLGSLLGTGPATPPSGAGGLLGSILGG